MLVQCRAIGKPLQMQLNRSILLAARTMQGHREPHGCRKQILGSEAEHCCIAKAALQKTKQRKIVGPMQGMLKHKRSS